jgi:hypothetical protein
MKKRMVIKLSKNGGATFILLVTLLTLLLPVCASSQSYGGSFQFQKTDSKMQISIVKYGGQKGPTALGAYRIPNSSFVLWSPREPGIGLFGAIGAAVTHIAEKAQMKEKVKNQEESFRIDMDKMIKDIIETEIEDDVRYSNVLLSDVNSENKKNVMEITPFSTIFFNDDYFEIGIRLDALYFDDNGSSEWKGIYEYTVPHDKPLIGKDGFTGNNGELLRQVVEEGLTKCVDAFLQDLNNEIENPTIDRTKTKNIANRINLPKGSILINETDEDWIVRQPVGLGMLSIVNRPSSFFRRGTSIHIIPKKSNKKGTEEESPFFAYKSPEKRAREEQKFQ